MGTASLHWDALLHSTGFHLIIIVITRFDSNRSNSDEVGLSPRYLVLKAGYNLGENWGPLIWILRIFRDMEAQKNGMVGVKKQQKK